MKKKVLFLAVLFLLSLKPEVKAQTNSSSKVDLENIASSLVNQCANIGEGDMVLVTGRVNQRELLENIAVNVRKKGAFPMILMNSDRLTRKMYTEVPEKYDAQTPEINMNLIKFIDTQISVASSETPDLLADISPERFKIRNEASKPVRDYIMENPIKLVQLGNGMYPTQATADEFGLTIDELSDLFWSGINVDYDKLSADCKKISALLESGKEIEITHSNGTSLKVKLAGVTPIVSDGILNEEDMKRGPAGYNVYLPAGEVYTATLAGSANGKVVVKNVTFRGKTIEELVLEFKDGKIASMDSQSDISSLKKYIESQTEGIDEFSSIDLGLNQNVKIPEGSKFASWVPAGMITVGIGNNIELGGDNESTGGLNFFLPGTTVKIDGKVLIDSGNLKM